MQKSARDIIREKYPTGLRGNWRGANLSRMKLSGARFAGSNLGRVSFKRSDLSYANFSRCDLTRAKFDHADLTGASFGDATLRYASFDGANLADTWWIGARISKANFNGIKNAIAFPNVGSRRATLLVVKHDTGLCFKTGCFWGNIDEFYAAVLETHGIFSPYGWQYRCLILCAKVALG